MRAASAQTAEPGPIIRKLRTADRLGAIAKGASKSRMKIAISCAIKMSMITLI